MRYHKEDFKAATKYLYSCKSNKPIGDSYITTKYRIVKYLPEKVFMIEETSSLKIEPRYYTEARFGEAGVFLYISPDTMRFLRVENAIKVLDKYISKQKSNEILTWSTLQPKTPAKAHAKKGSKSTPKKYVLRKLRTAADYRQTPITKEELLKSRVILESSGGREVYATEYIVNYINGTYYVNRRDYKYRTALPTKGRYRRYEDTDVKERTERATSKRIDGLVTMINSDIRRYGQQGSFGVFSTVQVIPIKVKKPTEKKAPAKKTTGKPSVKTVKKLVSQGKVKAGFVSRLGVRKQTPPPPKSKKADEARRAMLAGYRVSKSGKLYYETRENRTDKPHEKPRRGRKAPAKRGRK